MARRGRCPLHPRHPFRRAGCRGAAARKFGATGRNMGRIRPPKYRQAPDFRVERALAARDGPTMSAICAYVRLARRLTRPSTALPAWPAAPAAPGAPGTSRPGPAAVSARNERGRPRLEPGGERGRIRARWAGTWSVAQRDQPICGADGVAGIARPHPGHHRDCASRAPCVRPLGVPDDQGRRRATTL